MTCSVYGPVSWRVLARRTPLISAGPWHDRGVVSTSDEGSLHPQDRWPVAIDLPALNDPADERGRT